MFKNVVATLVCVTAFASCTKKEASDEIVIGFNPAESADVVEANGKQLAKIVQEKTGLKLKTFVATDFGSLVEAMRSGKVHIAFLPGFSYIQSEKVAGGKILLKAVRKGRAFYYSAIITAKDFKSLDDLKGKTIAWTDPSSASGHIMAKSALMELGITPDDYFSKQVFAGGHDALVLSVLNKTVDAGASLSNDPEGNDGIWHQIIKHDADKLKNLKVLFVSKPIPADGMATTNDFYSKHKDVVEKFTQIMIDLGKTAEGKKILYELYHIDEMVPATAEEYEPLRAAAKRLNIQG